MKKIGEDVNKEEGKTKQERRLVIVQRVHASTEGIGMASFSPWLSSREVTNLEYILLMRTLTSLDSLFICLTLLLTLEIHRGTVFDLNFP